MNKKGISVIVPVYNEEKTIKKVLDELVNIKEVNEIIVIDDNSIDKTIEIIKRLKSPKIILIKVNWPQINFNRCQQV